MKKRKIYVILFKLTIKGGTLYDEYTDKTSTVHYKSGKFPEYQIQQPVQR